MLTSAPAVPSTEIDLGECEREPICHLGFIQPHGHLLGFNANAEITHASENLGQHLSFAASDVLGRSLGQVLGPAADTLLREVVGGLSPGQLHHQFWDAKAERQSLWLHRVASQYILEWERHRIAPRARNATGERSSADCPRTAHSAAGAVGRRVNRAPHRV